MKESRQKKEKVRIQQWKNQNKSYWKEIDETRINQRGRKISKKEGDDQKAK